MKGRLNMKQFFNETEAAKELSISRISLRKYRNRGLLKPIVLSRVVLYTGEMLNDFSRAYIVRKGKPIQQRVDI
jgi:predicted site-specific integrase-resolvase